MKGLLLMSLIAILATVNAVPPELSDSFSFQGTGSTIINTSASVIILNHTRQNYAADTTRLLSVTDTLYILNGVEYSGFVLASGNDNLTYSDSDGTCTTSPYISTLMNGTNGYIALGNFTTGVLLQAQLRILVLIKTLLQYSLQ